MDCCEDAGRTSMPVEEEADLGAALRPVEEGGLLAVGSSTWIFDLGLFGFFLSAHMVVLARNIANTGVKRDELQDNY